MLNLNRNKHFEITTVAFTNKDLNKWICTIMKGLKRLQSDENFRNTIILSLESKMTNMVQLNVFCTFHCTRVILVLIQF